MKYFQIDETYSWKVIVLIHHRKEPQEVASLLSNGRKGIGKGRQLGDREKPLSRQQIAEIKMLHPRELPQLMRPRSRQQIADCEMLNARELP